MGASNVAMVGMWVLVEGVTEAATFMTVTGVVAI